MKRIIVGVLAGLMIGGVPSAATERRHQGLRDRVNVLSLKVWTNKQNIRFLQEAVLRLDAKAEQLRRIIVAHSHDDTRREVGHG